MAIERILKSLKSIRVAYSYYACVLCNAQNYIRVITINKQHVFTNINCLDITYYCSYCFKSIESINRNIKMNLLNSQGKMYCTQTLSLISA